MKNNLERSPALKLSNEEQAELESRLVLAKNRMGEILEMAVLAESLWIVDTFVYRLRNMNTDLSEPKRKREALEDKVEAKLSELGGLLKEIKIISDKLGIKLDADQFIKESMLTRFPTGIPNKDKDIMSLLYWKYDEYGNAQDPDIARLAASYRPQA